MSVTDSYKRLKSPEKDFMFSRYFQLKEQKKAIDTELKQIDKTFRPELDSLQRDVFFELIDGRKFSIKLSKRTGGWDAKKLEALIEANNMEVDDFKKPDTSIKTVRLDA